MMSRTTVPAGSGRAVPLRHGDRVRVIDVDGGQVGDVFAYAAADPNEYLSASHTRTATGRLFPEVGEHFVTNRRRPILTLVADTSPGIHDMLIAACDPERYRALGVTEHPSCAVNLRNALGQMGFSVDDVPQPVNVFMNIPVAEGGVLSWLPAVSRPGDTIVFEAMMDCVVVVSACPMDLNGINGHHPTSLAIELSRAEERIS
ncbi:uncharacterized protein YcgI (DUF1989 family) [Mycobacterium frederiksbergense]|uniref:Uncharacterized protein YcgI (DUF1989 family) n=1 Tax=Mycolicibacterium frederiksbergense TaxID=117567 RepID=A0ABT6KTN6_9MYCO|nr:urea carboxylase-associated family protein [Mycolicibacterium frederiksbergense]MDH6193636.1 uncharacterized protein YcgI (DUF1989 family) [Mycolicibacterium frederiksbergense]